MAHEGGSSADGTAAERAPRRREPILGRMDGPTLALIAAEIAVFIVQIFTGGPEPWALSGRQLAAGRWDTLLTHMFSHAGGLHIFMNLTALASFSAMVSPRLGGGARRWFRYWGLFLLSGLAGAALFLALHPTGVQPMVGASGAICGLWGAASRLPPDGGPPMPLRAPLTLARIRQFVVSNAILFAAIFVLVRLAGGLGGLAWEAHLGGYLFGLFTVRWFLEPTVEGPWGPRG